MAYQEDANEQVNKAMNRLRAQLYNTIEQMGLDEAQYAAYKQTIKNITATAWNSVTSIVKNLKE